MSVPLDQNKQQVQGLGSERNDDAIVQQEMLTGIQPERAEFVYVLWFVTHRSFSSHQEVVRRFSGVIPELLQDFREALSLPFAVSGEPERFASIRAPF
jgi:hypothetical protein